jgi:hypothetical protein
MKASESTILRAFHEQKRPLSADDIMPLLFEKDYYRLLSDIEDEFYSDGKKRESQEGLNQIRRRVLYHLKVLEDKGRIRLAKRGAKGKKYYSLENEERKEHYSGSPNVLLEEHNDDSYIIRENNDDWARKFSSLLIECKNNDTKTILRMLGYSKSISDAIALNNPDSHILTDELQDMIKRITSQQDIHFSAIIPLASDREPNKEPSFQRLVQKVIGCNATLILSLESTDLKKLETIKKIEEAARQCMDARLPLYIHNKDAKKAPVFVGSIGPYTVSERDYQKLNELLPEDRKAFVVGLNNVLCDVESFLKGMTVTELRRALLLKGTDLFVASLSLRRRAPELLPEQLFGRHALDIARDYYRFWNYGLKDPETDQENVIALLKSAKETIRSYAHAQSTIYTSCGMPTPFKTAFSVLFEDRRPRRFSESQFKKLVVKDIRDLMDKGIKDTLFLKQEASEIFNGGDRTRITKRNGNSTSEIYSEISFIQKSYTIPLVCYDFSSHERELTLHDFFSSRGDTKDAN